MAFLVVYGILIGLLPSLGDLAANVAASNQFGYARAATETPQPITNILSTPLVIDGKTIAPGQILYPGFDADVLWKFRWYSIINQLLIWTTIALVFGALLDRFILGRAPRTAPGEAPCPGKTASPGRRRAHRPSRAGDIGPALTAGEGGQVLDDLAALGPFFAVRAHPPGQAPAVALAARQRACRPARAAGGAHRSRSGRCWPPAAAARSARSTPRVAASAVHLGLVARLVSPALAAAALGQRLDMRLDGLWWQDELGGPVPLSVPVPAPATSPGPRDWHRELLAGVIAPLTTATSRLVPVSDRVLRGNVASGDQRRRRPGGPVPAGAGRPGAGGGPALFASPWLAGEPSPPGPAFRRSSCCLFYRLAPGSRSAICGDCILNKGS